MNRDEAVLIIKELLEMCRTMDGVYLCLVPPTGSTPIVTGGYQVHIRKTQVLDKPTEDCIEAITRKHQLSAQEIKEEEKMIIYRKH